jgi:hypothetical protein
MTYYFQILHPGRALALNWCVWNSVAHEVLDKYNGYKCHSQQDPCENCLARPFEEIGMIHFTEACKKPWTCYTVGSEYANNTALCQAFHHRWFKTRSALEQSWGRSGNGTGGHRTDFFFGYCASGGFPGYQKIEMKS